MNTTNVESQVDEINHSVHELRTFFHKSEAIAFLESLPDPRSIIILTPPPH